MRLLKNIKNNLQEQTLPGNWVLCERSENPSLQLHVYVPCKLKHFALSEQSWNFESLHSLKSKHKTFYGFVMKSI